ncbi:unnamed protein product [Cercopithifilaria johnstoni]|uniref:Uncharacterized protein n=1 Tax=Cercopithifilaria johnstoni TaxID=2874296 RepID=A0A8J2Q2S3_9BILA|nr:unnamed protein product [Cercopithifilaria johnstoni]
MLGHHSLYNLLDAVIRECERSIVTLMQGGEMMLSIDWKGRLCRRYQMKVFGLEKCKDEPLKGEKKYDDCDNI